MTHPSILPQYQCHKVVRAAPIAAMTETSVTVTLPGDAETTLKIPDNFYGRGRPQPGDYLVSYEDDYLSWSPAKVFLDGYEKLE